MCLQDTVVAIRKAGDEVVVANVQSDKYPDKIFSVDPDQVSDPGRTAWACSVRSWQLGCYLRPASAG
jgi:hypothetical protein